MDHRMEIFDSHVHLNHPDFEGREDAVWREALEAGVSGATVIGYDIESSRRALAIAERHPRLYAAVGVSPHEILAAPDNYIEELKRLATHPKVAAIGEAGLEYHYPAGPAEFQIEQFKRQAELADELGKPIVVHLREADDDFLRILEEAPPRSAVMHCFTASLRLMQTAVELGYLISFSGIVTFKKAEEIHEAARQVPLENLLVETDAPYLAPTPYRGKPCEPRMIKHTVERIADLRGVPPQTIAEATRANAHRVFQLDG